MTLAKIWFPDRAVLEEHDVNYDKADSIDHVEKLVTAGHTYLLNPSPNDPNADFIGTRRDVL